MDSTATNHVTPDLNNVQVCSPYHSQDHVIVGNGRHLPFHNTDNGILPTPSFPFKLTNVLYVPHILSNLLLVHKLTSDNNRTVTFDDKSFVVQDKTTKIPLFRGIHSQGVYHWPSSSLHILSPQHSSAFYSYCFYFV